ncbi:MAG: hypothetical protein GOU98_04665 [Candidatus Altiarchaeota archaeon]|nr:hypothetical protein [Candidatus Altiarchaeota archaeon]
MEKVRALVKDFKMGRIALGKELTGACISLLSNAITRKKNKFLVEKEAYLVELSSRPIDPLTKNFLEAFARTSSIDKMKKLLKTMDKYLKKSRKDLVPAGKPIFNNKRTIMVVGYSEVLADIINSNKNLMAYIPELSPTLTGRKMAKIVKNSILIPDSAIGYFMPSVDMVISRSCCVATTGLLASTSAKSSAIMAKWHEKPFYMAAELLRLGDSFVVTEHKWDVGVNNRAPLYDKIEPELVTGIITEEGILTHSMYIDKATKKKEELHK